MSVIDQLQKLIIERIKETQNVELLDYILKLLSMK